ncbi:hypothetical protein TNCV_4414521 [Trichonephila clavipes]|uniref:Uncharacterized protein n=1 Tax=Trichonephila clavipes TaxID=2585209 RepID=A0A8X6S029_TRICX|nr:hypothetical protein TNCV_4414521 [Trichonephila clavipes]
MSFVRNGFVHCDNPHRPISVPNKSRSGKKIVQLGHEKSTTLRFKKTETLKPLPKETLSVFVADTPSVYIRNCVHSRTLFTQEDVRTFLLSHFQASEKGLCPIIAGKYLSPYSPAHVLTKGGLTVTRAETVPIVWT